MDFIKWKLETTPIPTFRLLAGISEKAESKKTSKQTLFGLGYSIQQGLSPTHGGLTDPFLEP
jgi:hypothetical protein